MSDATFKSHFAAVALLAGAVGKLIHLFDPAERAEVCAIITDVQKTADDINAFIDGSAPIPAYDPSKSLTVDAAYALETADDAEREPQTSQSLAVEIPQAEYKAPERKPMFDPYTGVPLAVQNMDGEGETNSAHDVASQGA